MKVDIPGKLFISGEYAVVYGAHAILAPSLHTMRFEIRKAEEPLVHSLKYGEAFYLESSHPMPNPLRKAYVMIRRYLDETGVPFSPFHLEVDSALDIEGQKLGLGSSAALTLGMIKTVLSFHKINLSDLALYKLSVLAMIDEEHFTSYGDLALAACRQWLLYRKFDSAWLKNHMHLPSDVLIDMPWMNLEIRPFTPKKLHMLVVNTGTPAKSKRLVESFNHAISGHYKTIFTDESDLLSLELFNKLRLGEKPHETIEKLRSLMDDSENHVNMTLFTEAMRTIEKHLTPFRARVKFSGAGGGDNVLAFFENETDKENAAEKLEALGYTLIGYERRGFDES